MRVGVVEGERDLGAEDFPCFILSSHRLHLKFASCLCCVAGVSIKYFSFDIHGKALHCSSLSIRLLSLSILSYVSIHLACSATGCL